MEKFERSEVGPKTMVIQEMDIHNGDEIPRICVENESDGTQDRAPGNTVKERGRSRQGSID